MPGDDYYGPYGYGVPPYSEGGSYSNRITVYPCDYGTGTPTGYHKFVVSEGFVICERCGKEKK